MQRVFTIDPDHAKPVSASFPVEIDITTWLNGAYISNVSFSAEDMSTGRSAASVVNQTNSSFTNTLLKPWIQAGSGDSTYCVTMVVTTNDTPAVTEEFYLIFTVSDNVPRTGPKG